MGKKNEATNIGKSSKKWGPNDIVKSYEIGPTLYAVAFNYQICKLDEKKQGELAQVGAEIAFESHQAMRIDTTALDAGIIYLHRNPLVQTALEFDIVIALTLLESFIRHAV